MIKIPRRNFLKWGGMSILSLPFITKLNLAYGNSISGKKSSYWRGEEGSQYFVQNNLKHTNNTTLNICKKIIIF